jgi:hypothetical protein
MSDNTLKNMSITGQKCLQEDHEWSSWENRDKNDWV